MNPIIRHRYGRGFLRLSRFLRASGDWYGGKTVVMASVALITGLMPLCNVQYRESPQKTARLEEFVQEGEYSSFLKAARKSRLYTASKNELVYNLDTGLADVFLGNYDRGAKRLTKVGELSEKHYTKSISRQVLSVLTNDLSLPYYGEDYEVMLAGNAAMLGFAALGNLEDALVEARLSEHRLSVMSDTYDGGDKYHNDAFSHYLAGMLFEAADMRDNARISFALADSAYGSRFFPMKPPGVAEACVRFRNEADQTAVSYSPATDSGESPAMSPLIICAFTGKGPTKDETVVRAHFTNKGIDHVVKIAIPVIRERPGSIRGARLSLGDRSMTMDLAADYNHIAVNAFNDRKALIYTKTLARVSARYVILKATKEKTVEKLKKKYEKAKEEHGEDSSEAASVWISMKTASLGLDMLANELLEHADTRCSLLLPGQAYVQRCALPPGSHTVTLEYTDASGSVIDRETRDIEVTPGKPTVQIFSALY